MWYDHAMKKQEKKEVKTSGNRRKIAAASVGILAAAALLVGTLIPSASDVVSPARIIDPPAVVLQLEEEDAVQTEQSTPENRKALRASERLKGWILGLPQALRLLLVLPLWGLGTFLSSVLSALWAGLLSPGLAFVMSWILGAAVLLGAFGLGAKLLFPELPWRKIFARRNLYILGAGALLLTAADGVLPFYWPGYSLVSTGLKAFVSLGLIALLLLRLKKKKSLFFS